MLRGINFGPVLQASGATNFYGPGFGRGHGWWFHPLLFPLGLNWKGSTTVTKTTTLFARRGNMPRKRDGVTPRELMPRCIIVKPRRKVVLNAVSLSGPGLDFLLASGEWQRRTEPFFISVAPSSETPKGRKMELEEVFRRLAAAKRDGQFRAEWGLQINVSCPNSDADPSALIDEVAPTLESAAQILPPTIPVTAKFGPELPPKTLKQIIAAASSGRLDAVCVFNTLPFGRYPRWAEGLPPVDWHGLFGTADPKESPLAKRFPGFAGGLSGAPLLPFLVAWLCQARKEGITIPINAGGGILSPVAARAVFDAEADSISLGSIALLAPIKVGAAIRAAREYARRISKPAFPPRMVEYNV